MGDVPTPPEVEPTPTNAERVNAAIEAVMPGVKPRRAILFVLVGLGLALGGVFAALGIMALLALALTDQVVAL